MDERWYLIITEPNRESDAAWHLRRQHYAVFYPRCWHTWSRDGITTSELRPYFPGYLFAAIVAGAQSVGQIRDTIGVAAVRYEAGEAYQLPRETLFALRRHFDPDGVEPLPPRTAKHLRKLLRGVKGAIRDELLAVVERISDRGNVRVGRSGRQQRKRLADLVGEPAGVAA